MDEHILYVERIANSPSAEYDEITATVYASPEHGSDTVKIAQGVKIDLDVNGDGDLEDALRKVVAKKVSPCFEVSRDVVQWRIARAAALGRHFALPCEPPGSCS